MVNVVRHVSANKAMFNQGNLCCGASSNRISAGGLNVLFMKRLKLLSKHSERLQVFAWLKAHGFPRGYVHFRTSTRVPSDASLPRLDREDAEAPQLNPIIGLEGVFHAIEDSVYCLFCFGLADSRPFYDLIDKVKFDHWNLRRRILGPLVENP